MPAQPLHASWARLVAALALGSPPELRTCPVCGREVRRAATLCGYCWTKLTSPPARTADDAAAPPNGAV